MEEASILCLLNCVLLCKRHLHPISRFHPGYRGPGSVRGGVEEVGRKAIQGGREALEFEEREEEKDGD